MSLKRDRSKSLAAKNGARLFSVILGAILTAGIFGCQDGSIEAIQVNINNDPLEQPRTMLKRYAAGAPIGSEATSFEFIVNEVKKSDPARGETLEKGFAKLQKADPSQLPELANELLNSIAPAGIPAPK